MASVGGYFYCVKTNDNICLSSLLERKGNLRRVRWEGRFALGGFRGGPFRGVGLPARALMGPVVLS